MAGVPGKALPVGWDMIPGARGCTPQARENQIEHVFYPVFPPNEGADRLLSWLREHPLES